LAGGGDTRPLDMPLIIIIIIIIIVVVVVNTGRYKSAHRKARQGPKL
jgi:uncharacterized protein YpmB